MLGRRPEKDLGREQGAKRRRKWEEGEGGGSPEEQDDAGVEITAADIKEWEQREQLEEEMLKEVQESEAGAQPQPDAPPQPGPPQLGQPQPVPQPPPRQQAPPPPRASELALAVAAPTAPPPQGAPGMSAALAMVAPPRTGPGLRLGEGDDSGRSRDEIRVIKEMLAEDINAFILTNNIDGPAGRDLRIEPVHVQLAILDRGPLTSCTNPSGALIGRIRDAKKTGPKGGMSGAIHQSLQVPMPTSVPVAAAGGADGNLMAGLPTAGNLVGMPGSNPLVEKYIVDNKLDLGASRAMRTEAKEVIDKVLSMGPMVNTNNTSASLMARIRNVRTNMAGTTQAATAGGMSMAPKPALAAAPALPAGPVQDSVVNDAAMRAIQALKAKIDGEAPGAPGGVGGQDTLQSASLSAADAQLQAEAMRAMQAMNGINMRDL